MTFHPYNQQELAGRDSRLLSVFQPPSGVGRQLFFPSVAHGTGRDEATKYGVVL